MIVPNSSTRCTVAIQGRTFKNDQMGILDCGGHFQFDTSVTKLMSDAIPYFPCFSSALDLCMCVKADFSVRLRLYIEHVFLNHNLSVMIPGIREKVSIFCPTAGIPHKHVP